MSLIDFLHSSRCEYSLHCRNISVVEKEVPPQTFLGIYYKKYYLSKLRKIVTTEIHLTLRMQNRGLWVCIHSS